MISLRLEMPALGLRAEISRYKRGWYHWLQIRHADDFPIVQCSGTVAFVFRVIRETIKLQLEKRFT